ncbi:MAG: Dienelactone hydrolase family, partial [Actinomycetota bacterium]|nr:Dienelactone hydrolase family [Actinomycetota bacterium]
MTAIAVPFFVALPAAPPPWPGIVVVMEGDGMKPQLLRVCERLAAEGYAVAAP